MFNTYLTDHASIVSECHEPRKGTIVVFPNGDKDLSFKVQVPWAQLAVSFYVDTAVASFGMFVFYFKSQKGGPR